MELPKYPNAAARPVDLRATVQVGVPWRRIKDVEECADATNGALLSLRGDAQFKS